MTPPLPEPPTRPRPSPDDHAAELSSQIEARLMRALVGASSTMSEAPGLREAVCGYVGELKAQGDPPERVLVKLKRLVHDALPAGDSLREPSTILGEVVTWCIDEYYRG